MSPPASSRIALVGIVGAAFNLRIAIVGVGPLLDEIRDDFGVSSAVAGLVVTIPLICMGVFAFAGSPAIARLGYSRLFQACLAAIAAGSLLRALMPDIALVLFFTLPIGIAIALAGVTLGPVVKHAFAERGGALMGASVAAMGVGATVSSLTAVPLSHALGGWRWPLGLAAIPAALAVVLWRWSGVAADMGRPPRAALRRPPLRTLAPLAGVMTFQALAYTATIVWMATAFENEGFSETTAGVFVAYASVLVIPAAVFVPGLSDGRDRRPWIALTAALEGAGILGLAFAIDVAPWLWLAIFAAGAGPIFPLALALPLDVARDPDEAASLTVWTLGVGFTASSLGPTLIGGLHDATGDFVLPFALLGGCALVAGLVGQVVRPGFGRPRPAEAVGS